MNRFVGFALALAGAALLAACAGTQPVPADMPARPPREQIRQFALEGRVALRNEARNFVVHLAWQHVGANDSIFVTSALGQGIAQLHGSASGAQLDTADRQRYLAPDLDALSEQVFGERLPLGNMHHWVLGRPAALPTGVERDQHGRLARLIEADWYVEYIAYESPLAEALPTLIRLVRGNVEVRLKIDRWDLEL